MYSVLGHEIRVFLAHPGGPYFTNKDEGHWGIPKGETEDGEDLLNAAIREFSEEIGLAPNGPYINLGFVQLKSGKIVHAWAFAGEWPEQKVPASNTCTVEWPPKSGQMLEIPEIDRAELFPVGQALRKINAAQLPFITRLLECLK